MITRFQALVARESMAEVYNREGNALTVIRIVGDRARWMVETESGYGDRYIYCPGDLTPSGHLETLISNHTYVEHSMSWHAVIDGKCVTEPLSY